MGASPGAAESLTRMNAEIDVRPVLPSIRVPTLVIHRKGDRLFLIDEGRFIADRIPSARFLELQGSDHLPFVGDQDSMLDPIESFLTGISQQPSPEVALATALFLDHPAEHSDSGRYVSHLRREIEWFRGKQADINGGAPLATFDGPARAVRCAFSMVSQGSRMGLPTRAAVHTGECEFNPDGLPSGYAIELTGRILPVTHPGEVVVSRVVKDLVAGSGIQFSKHRSLMLDGEDWSLFQVVSC
jgi:hypothetical protein